MFIRTARLFLRPCWPEDRHEMLALINEGPLTASATGLPWPLTAEDAQRFVERPVDKQLPHFFITLPKINGGELIGGIGLGRDGDEIGLGYWVIKAHHGHGYAAEAINAVLSMARTLGHNRVIASIFQVTQPRPTSWKRLASKLRTKCDRAWHCRRQEKRWLRRICST